MRNKLQAVKIDYKQRNEAKQIFIKRLKEIRDDNKLKNKDFAEFLGISEKTLSNLLKGEYSPRLDTLVLISKKVKVTVAYLLGEDETQLYKDETKSIAEYTGLSEKAFNNLHFIKLLNERHGAFPNDHDEEKSHGEKKPFFYFINALLSNSSTLDVDVVDVDLEYYCKVSKQLREVELVYKKTNERKDKMEKDYYGYEAILDEYNMVLDIINYKTSDSDVDIFASDEELSDIYDSYSSLPIEELIERKNELEEEIPKANEFFETYDKVQHELDEYTYQIDELKNRKARAFMNIFEILNKLSEQ